jgi:lipoprotein-releasing system ATP-binding protein
MIKASSIYKSYGTLEVLKGVNIVINKGEIISIVGASGAGKTTLLHILGTLDRANKGTLEINTTNISSLSDKKLADFRNKNIGFVFQFHHLLPEFTALENVCIPAFIAGTSKSKAEEKATELLSFFGLVVRMHHKQN